MGENNGDSVKTVFDIGFQSNDYQPIPAKLGVFIDTTKLYSLILVLMTLTFVNGLRAMRLLGFPFSVFRKVFDSGIKWI